VSDFSLDAHVLDLEAVVDRLSLDNFALLAGVHAGPVAITYASRHPERVSHLVLYCSFARASEFFRSSPEVQALQALHDKDWDVFTDTVGHVVFGWSAAEQARRHAELMRQGMTPEAFRAAFSAADQFDVAPLLPQVRSPTLVLHRRQVPYPDVSNARDLAASIPDARLTVLEGTTVAPWVGDMEAAASAVDEFLAEGRRPAKAKARKPAKPKKRKAATPTGLATIFFTDMEGSTSLTDRLGDAKAQEVRRTHDSIVRQALKAQGGSETKHTGDGIMASFPFASRAIECAVAVQRAIAEHGETPLRVRIGLNAGEPVAEEADLFGTAVNLAKRICDHAEPGQILVSDVVQQLAAGKGFTFADKGEATLKGFEKPVRLHEVRWRE
jgi:class 3 adenylate cyclase